MKEYSSIDEGIGSPDGYLTIGLVITWCLILLTLVKGIKSSGKASYFLAIFPYLVLFTLFIRVCTLPGAFDGIAFLLTPKWEKLLEASVWYEATTQAFYSLTVCLGMITVYASYNSFDRNIYRLV